MDLRLQNLFRGGDLVIDVGCGDGEPLDDVGGLYRNAVGIDISTERLKWRSAMPSGWTFMLTDLNRGIPMMPDVADAVHANQVIEHVGNPLFFAMEAHRVLRPGGMFVATTPNVRYLPHVWRLIAKGQGPITGGNKSKTPTDWDSGHIHFFTTNDLMWIAKQAGFTHVRTRALVAPNGHQQPLRRLLDQRADSRLVKSFLTGNILLVAIK